MFRGANGGFGNEESSIGVSDRGHHRCLCLGGPVTSSSVARWWLGLGWWTRGRTNWSGGDWGHSLQRLRLWTRLRLLWRTGLRLLWRLCPWVLRRLRPSVLQLRLRPRILRRVPVGLLCWSRVSARYSPRIRL